MNSRPCSLALLLFAAWAFLTDDSHAKESKHRQTAISPIDLVYREKITLPFAERWAVSQNSAEIYYAIRSEVFSIHLRSRKRIRIASFEGSIRELVLSPSGLNLVICTSNNAILAQRQGARSAWKTRQLPAKWTNACIASEETCIAGLLPGGGGAQRVDFFSLKSEEMVHRSYAELEGLNENTPLLATKDGKFLLVGTGFAINADYLLEHSKTIGGYGIYDLAAGPLRGDRFLSVAQPARLEGKYSIARVFKTELFLERFGGAAVPVRWNPRLRIHEAQAAGGNEIWVMLSNDLGTDRLILKRYRVLL